MKLKEYIRNYRAHWKQISPAKIYECSKCGQLVMTEYIDAYRYCHGCGRKMIDPTEYEPDDMYVRYIDTDSIKTEVKYDQRSTI